MIFAGVLAYWYVLSCAVVWAYNRIRGVRSGERAGQSEIKFGLGRPSFYVALAISSIAAGIVAFIISGNLAGLILPGPSLSELMVLSLIVGPMAAGAYIGVYFFYKKFLANTLVGEMDDVRKTILALAVFGSVGALIGFLNSVNDLLRDVTVGIVLFAVPVAVFAVLQRKLQRAILGE
jgi:hypothetical protein